MRLDRQHVEAAAGDVDAERARAALAQQLDRLTQRLRVAHAPVDDAVDDQRARRAAERRRGAFEVAHETSPEKASVSLIATQSCMPSDQTRVFASIALACNKWRMVSLVTGPWRSLSRA